MVGFSLAPFESAGRELAVVSALAHVAAAVEHAAWHTLHRKLLGYFSFTPNSSEGTSMVVVEGVAVVSSA